MHNMHKRTLAVCFLTFIPLMSSAALRPVFTLSSGVARTSIYSSKSILFGPYPNTYDGTNHYDTEIDTGLFAGAEMAFLQNWAFQAGVSYFENNSFTPSGRVYEFADPDFNTLTYQYQIKSERISIDTKLSRAFHGGKWHPYLSASLGRAFNTAYAYTETPVTTADSPMTIGFSRHSTNTFTWSLGFGADVDISSHLRLGAGYRFLDMGNATLGVTPLQNGTSTISITHLYSNEVLAQISYLL